MRYFAVLTAVVLSAHSQTWPLVNFAQRLEVEISNPSTHPIDTLAILPMPAAMRIAPGIPGTLAIATIDGIAVPCPADPDEFLFAGKLAPGETRTAHIYYSTTLQDS